jgi:hypothetical protein
MTTAPLTTYPTAPAFPAAPTAAIAVQGPSGEPSPGSPQALLLLASAGVLPANSGVDDPRFSAEAIKASLSRLLEVKQQQELLNQEQKELNEQLRLAHLRGDLLSLLPTGKDGNGYQITPDLVLNRRAGRKQWSYSLDCKQIECQLKARQSYEQQSGLATYALGSAFWEVRPAKG